MKDKNKAIIGTFSGKCCDATVSNNNDMFLGKDLFSNLFQSEEYKRGIELGHYIGFLGHPEDPGCMDFEHACIVMTECHMDENGEIFGTFNLIDTPVGRIVKAFIDAGVTFGISIRGAGDVAGDGTVDPETFVFRGFDLVAFPAYDDAIPEFQAIAASSDLDKQVKYKKVCATVNKNLQSIKSSTTLETIQAQFNENSDEYNVIEKRKAELADDGIVEEDDMEVVLNEKIKGMTELYLAEVEASNKLKKDIDHLKKELANASTQYSRKLSSIRRITASQINALENELSSITGSYKVSVAASKKLKSQIEQLKNDNLKYTHKIEANSKTICDRDSTIADLEAKLRKTVTASSKVENRASNLDEEVKSLRARVEAAEQMVLNYQQAYANMYANALGLHLDNIAVTADTTVSQLQKMISGGTSTANIAAAPFVEPEPVEVTDAQENEEDIVTL